MKEDQERDEDLSDAELQALRRGFLAARVHSVDAPFDWLQDQLAAAEARGYAAEARGREAGRRELFIELFGDPATRDGEPVPDSREALEARRDSLVEQIEARGREQGRQAMWDEILVKLRDRAAFIDWGLREPCGGPFRNPNELAADFLLDDALRRASSTPTGEPGGGS